MINKIKRLFEREYIDIRILKKPYQDGFRLVKIPYNKSILVLSTLLIIIALITPFTNIWLIPIALWVLKRFG